MGKRGMRKDNYKDEINLNNTSWDYMFNRDAGQEPKQSNKDVNI